MAKNSNPNPDLTPQRTGPALMARAKQLAAPRHFSGDCRQRGDGANDLLTPPLIASAASNAALLPDRALLMGDRPGIAPTFMSRARRFS